VTVIALLRLVLMTPWRSAAEVTFHGPARTQTVEDARRLSAETMSAWSLPEFEERVTAIVAELVANAVRHARTAVDLSLIRRGSRLRIEVRDGDPAPPRRRDPEFLDENGRGMLIIERYSTGWGSIPQPDGKIVWVEVDLGPGAS
jgi:anti-sigma regulatory factor (Ser/Thr protein kinase)